MVRWREAWPTIRAELIRYVQFVLAVILIGIVLAIASDAPQCSFAC